MNLPFLIFFTVLTLSTAQIKTGVLKVFKNRVNDIIDKSAGNIQCASHLKSLVGDVYSHKKWAIQMIDAWAKLAPGVLTGNIFQLGNFDECIDVHVEKNEDTIDGKYCTLVLTPRSNFSSDFNFIFDTEALTDWIGTPLQFHQSRILKKVKWTHGVCIPKSCSVKSLQKIWDYVENTFQLPVHASFMETLCHYKGKKTFPFYYDKYVYVFFGICILIITLSTLYDVLYHQHLEGEKDNILISASAYRNFKKIFSYSDETGDLSCLDGMKVLSLLWVIMGHRYMCNVFTANLNGFYVLQATKQLKYTLVNSAPFAVDTFLTLSGLLLSYGFTKYRLSLGEKRKPAYMGFYIFRFFRLCPALLATILFYSSVLKTLNDGPGWALLMNKLAVSCKHTWWATLLFFSNYVEPLYQCVEHTWYLNVDSQLYFISPLIFIFLHKHPWKTGIVCFLVGVFTAIYAFVITFNNNIGAVVHEGGNGFYMSIYQSTIVRMNPWLLGIFVGYLIVHYKHVKIPNVLNIFMWIFSLGVITYSVLSHVSFTRNGYSNLRSATFNAIARPIWGLAICLMVFSCATGHGGIINKFLSLPVFRILVRLSYSAYLVHPGVLLYLSAGQRTSQNFTYQKVLHDFWGDIIFIYGVSTVWCLAFESPFVNMGKLLLKGQEGGERQGKKLIKKGKEIEKPLKEFTKSNGKKANRKNIKIVVYSVEDKEK